ncbi:integrase [Luteibacter jiangsuensis]|uniref:Integrase n=1 Tax=Luteibacter jiangsuensis TaxID=637577 RepID=A0ABX0QAG6_9GAMM|nr:integrase [Luteibacter jiangsuensis]NID06601.1 integrase [Luteibacter jiangsuensis]
MTRGRKRRFDPTIPGHIDQKKLPVGIYWNRRDRYWYTLAGKPAKRIRVAEADVLMSDLHKAMEAVRGVKTDTLDYLLDKFDGSAHFRGLAAATQEGYAYAHEALRKHPTKLGIPFAKLPLSTITTPLLQRLVDQIAEEFPTKANAIKRYLSVAFNWGVRRGHCAGNPAKGVAQAKERRAHRMPEEDVMKGVAAFLRARGAMSGRRKGSLAPYVWAVAALAYLCRMRGVEVRDLTDASVTDEGLMVVRRKGSRPTLVRWSAELRDACDWLAARRTEVWARKRMPIPLQAKDRPLVISEDGAPLSKGAMSSAWRRAMAAAKEAGLIVEEQRFGLHGLKHRGITDTEGDTAEKQQASGHKTQQMVHHYDHSIPVVDVAGKRVKKPAK